MTWGSSATLETTMDLLAPKIADITDEGLSLSGDVTAEELRLTEADALLSGPLAVGLDLRAVEGTVCVTGVVEGTAIRQCVRCLKDFEDRIAFSVRVAYEREVKAPPPAAKREDPKKKKSAPPVDTEPEETNDDIYSYAGDHLELGPMLREQLILVAPMHPLCKEDCLGLCLRCGKDLNTGPCHCADEPMGGPFQVLRKLKQKND
jgi:DUF177 domain-containing protein